MNYIRIVETEVNQDGEKVPCLRVALDGEFTIADLLKIIETLEAKKELISG